MATLGFLGRLFGKKKAAGRPGVKMKPGTDVVHTPLRCPACSREIARVTPDQGIATCQCGKSFAILNYEPKPIPPDFKLDGA